MRKRLRWPWKVGRVTLEDQRPGSKVWGAAGALPNCSRHALQRRPTARSPACQFILQILKDAASGSPQPHYCTRVYPTSGAWLLPDRDGSTPCQVPGRCQEGPESTSEGQHPGALAGIGNLASCPEQSASQAGMVAVLGCSRRQCAD